jgi:uncharacterized protein (UPF0276 family)
VWDLYRYTLGRLGPIPTMIERDDHIPALPDLIAELDEARRIGDSVDLECPDRNLDPRLDPSMASRRYA